MSVQAKPEGPQWNENAALAAGTPLVNIDAGAVQFVGRHPLLLEASTVTVPLPVLFNLVGQLLAILSSEGPAGDALRAHIGGRPVLRIEPGNIPPAKGH